MCILELPLCPDAVVVGRETEAVFDVDELINVESPRGSKPPVDANGGEMVMLEGSAG